MSAVLATCFFVRRHQIRQDTARIPATREFHGMSSQLVKAMPSLIFTKVQEDNCTSSTCAICLEDYSVGQKLRVLPCRHKFHAACVDLWLTSWRTFCPVCKRDARAGTSNPPASESTPLLSSSIQLPAESTALSSFRSIVAASPPRPISRHPSSQSISRTYSNSGIPRTPNPHRCYTNSPAISTSRSNVDLANMSSPWSHTSHLASTHSLGGGHLSPPINIRYTSPHLGYGSPSLYIGSSHISNSAYGSLSYYPGSSGQQYPYLSHRTESGPSLFTMVPQSPQQTQLLHGGESGTSLSAAASTQSLRQAYLQHCPDSDASLSAMTSAQSLPGCWLLIQSSPFQKSPSAWHWLFFLEPPCLMKNPIWCKTSWLMEAYPRNRLAPATMAIEQVTRLLVRSENQWPKSDQLLAWSLEEANGYDCIKDRLDLRRVWGTHHSQKWCSRARVFV